MKEQKVSKYEIIRIPMKCRNGPIEKRNCSIDFFCSFFYLGVIALVVIYGFSVPTNPTNVSELQEVFSEDSKPHPLIALYLTRDRMLLCLIVTAVLSLIMVLPTLIAPKIVGNVYIPAFLIITFLLGIFYLAVGFDLPLPFISQKMKQNKNGFLMMGILLAVSFLISLLTYLQNQQKIKRIQLILLISKACFLDNWWITFVSFLLSMLSLTALNLNISLIWKTQYSEDTFFLSNSLMFVIIICETLLTHGLIEAFSDFIFESVTIYWYFNETKRGQNYHRIINLFESLRLVFFHFSSIIYGFILAFIPEKLNSLLNKCSQNLECCDKNFGQINLSKFCYLQIILQSLSFSEANNQIVKLKKRAQVNLPQIYMMGDFYITLANMFTIVITLSIFFVILIQQHERIFFNLLNLILPFYVMFLLTLQVTQHFMNIAGLAGDTITLLYTFDLELQKQNYNEITPYSCPFSIKEQIYKIRFVDESDENEF